MRVLYEVKAILKHKVTLICFMILFFLNCLNLSEFIQKNTIDKNEFIKNLESEILPVKSQIESGIRNTANSIYPDDQRAQINNYHYFSYWCYVTSKENELELLKNNAVDIEYQFMLNDLRIVLSEMNQLREELKNDYSAYEVFDDEISIYKNELKLEELPFDSLNLKRDPGKDVRATGIERNENYESDRVQAMYYFTLLDQGKTPLSFESLSPWSYMASQISLNAIFPVLTILMALLFATVYLLDAKNNRSIQLLLTQPTNRIKVILTQVSALLIVFMLLMITSLIIPVIVMGFKYGWDNFNLPILIDLNTYTGFELYQHTDENWQTFGLSTFPASKLTSFESMKTTLYIPPVLECMGMINILGFALILSGLKISVMILIGAAGVYLFHTNWKTFVMTGIVSGLYLATQTTQNGIIVAFNPLDIRASFVVAQGAGNVTWLHAVLLCAVTIIVLFTIIELGFNKKDYS